MGNVRIPIDEFEAHMIEVFERVLREREAVVIEIDPSRTVTLYPGESSSREEHDITLEDYEAFQSSFGGWGDLDAEVFLADVYASRDQSGRPPVEF